MSAKNCEACDGRGWLHTHNSDTRQNEIQRCDACETFDGDESALNEVVRAASATPALLAALESVGSDLSEAVENDKLRDAERWEILRGALDEVRAAIAKAKGGES